MKCSLLMTAREDRRAPRDRVVPGRRRSDSNSEVTSADPDASAETGDEYGAFPRLTTEQIRMLESYGERGRTHTGDVLYRAGDSNCDFFVVILEGTVASVVRD